VGFASASNTVVSVTVEFGDGGKESFTIPDEDVCVLRPSSEDDATAAIAGADGTAAVATNVRLSRKRNARVTMAAQVKEERESTLDVTEVSAPSPLEAWGKALVLLELVDATTVELAMSRHGELARHYGEIKSELEGIAAKKDREELQIRNAERAKLLSTYRKVRGEEVRKRASAALRKFQRADTVRGERTLVPGEQRFARPSINSVVPLALHALLARYSALLALSL